MPDKTVLFLGGATVRTELSLKEVKDRIQRRVMIPAHERGSDFQVLCNPDAVIWICEEFIEAPSEA